MKPYIITHMMTSVDGRIDCPMVGQLSTDEYYIALKRLGKLWKSNEADCNPYKLRLESVEQWETDIVWLRYKVKK